MERKYDEMIKENHKVIDKVLMEAKPKKPSPPKPKANKPKTILTRESSKIVEVHIDSSKDEDDNNQFYNTLKKPYFFVVGMLVSLDTLQDIGDPLQENVDTTSEVDYVDLYSFCWPLVFHT